MLELIGSETKTSTSEILAGTPRLLPRSGESAQALIAEAVKTNHVNLSAERQSRFANLLGKKQFNMILGTLVVTGLAAAAGFQIAKEGAAHNPALHPNTPGHVAKQ
jgi:hypothetical protein